MRAQWGGREADGEMMGGDASYAPGQAQRLTRGALHFGENTAKSVGPAEIIAQSPSRFRHQMSTLFMTMSYLCEDDLTTVAEGKKQAPCGDPVVLATRGDVLTPGAEGLHPDQWVPSTVQRCCGPGDAGWRPSDSRRWGAAPWPAGAKFLGQRCLSIRLVMFNKWNNLVLCLS